MKTCLGNPVFPPVHDVPAAQPIQPATVRLCTPESIVIIGILPYTEICGFLWCYTALPLHFVDSQWPLWQLATLFTLCYIPRVIMTEVFVRLGDWICVPICAIALLSNIMMLLYPESLAAVSFAICATCTSLCPTALRGFAHTRFADSGEWQLQRALRILTLADTFGYATAPFIGGVLYDAGGLRACAGFALATTTLGTVLPLSLKVYRQSFAGYWGCGSTRFNRRTAPSAEPEVTPDAAVAEPTHPGAEVTGSPADTARAPPETTAAAGDEGRTSLLLAPTLTIMLAGVFSNICTYAVEWCLYALYFRLQYGWSGSWTGFAQMIGDLLGGTVLGLSTMACVTKRAGQVHLPRVVRALLRPPLGVALLLFCHAGLMVMLAQPHFAIALIGQVLMGTVYVFAEQFLQELLLVYSFGEHRLYRRLVSLHYLFFTGGCALCAPIAYGLYEASSFASAFYVTAGCAAAAGGVFGLYFASRLARTSSGVLGSLREAEAEMREAARATSKLQAS